MSDKDLDKLFKTKLEELQSNPSPQAWDKISEEIGGSRKGMIWWRFAAAILLLVSIVGIVQWNLSDTSSPQLATQDTPVSEPAEDKAIDSANSSEEEFQQTLPEVNQEEQLAMAEEVTTSSNQTQKAENNNKPATQAPVAQKPSENIKENQNSNNILDETNETIAQVDQPQANDEIESSFPTEEEIAEVAAVTSVQGSTRSFSIEQFGNAQRSEVTEEAVVQDKEEKGLKKIWNLLRQVKEPENGIGDLREMKNGLFAFGKSKKESDNQ